MVVSASIARAADAPSLNVTGLSATQYAPGAWVPVAVDVVNPGSEPLEGVVRIPLRGPDGSPADGPAVVEHRVYVPARARVRSDDYVYLNEAPPRTENEKDHAAPAVAIATLYTGSGREVARTPLNLISITQVWTTEFSPSGNVIAYLISSLEERSTGAYEIDEMIGALQVATGVGYQSRAVDPVYLPARAVALASVSTVVLDAAPGEVDAAQRAVLIDWVRAGGVLVVAAPDATSDATGTWLEPLMPVRVVGRRVASEISMGEAAGTWAVQASSLKPFGRDAEADEDDEPAPKQAKLPAKNAKPTDKAKPAEKPKVVERVPQMPRDLTSPLPLIAPVEVVEAIDTLDPTGVTVLARDASYVHVAYRRVGLGRVAFTSFPVGSLDMYDARAGQLWKAIVGPPRPGVVGAVPALPVSSTQLEKNLPQALSSMLGVTVPSWSVAAGVGGGYLLLVIVAQLALGGARRPQAFAVSVGGAVVLAGALLAFGQLRQRGQPFASAGVSVVDIFPEGGGYRQDTIALHGRDPGAIELAAGAGVESVRTTAGATREVPVLRTRPFGLTLAPQSVSTESVGRLIQVRGTVPASVKVSAVGSFGADGLTVSIQNGAPETLASPLVVWNGTSFNLPDVAPGATTQVISTASQNPRGTFTGGAVFTSERDRLRGDVLRWLGEPVSGDNVSTAPLEQTPFLAAWVSDATVPSPLVIRPPVDTTRTLALLRVPLRIDPSPAGSTVRIGAAFSKLVFGPALVSLYNPIAGQWLDSNQDASLVVGFEAPAAVGRLRPTRVTIVGDLNAPRQTVTVVGDQVRDGRPVDNLAGRVLGTWTNPVTPQSVSFDVAPDDVDSTGRVWVRVDVKNPAPDGTPVSWRIVELAASFDEATVQ